MKVWKLVSGILSIVFFVVVTFQSCAAGLVNAIDENTTDLSAGGGIIVAVLMLAGGIVSVATKNSGKKGHIATLVIFGLAALLGFASQGVFADLIVWSVWCLICAAVSLIGILTAGKKKEE